VLAAWLLAVAARPEVREGSRVVAALRLAEGEAVVLDGRLDEPAWSRAAAALDFRQREPQEGAAATEPTEARIAYDAATLYVGVRALDRAPDALIARILQRDRLMEPRGLDGRHAFAGDDAVAILLDPFLDRRNAVVFATNPLGAEFDALVSDESGSFNADWRAVFQVAAARDASGWSAEFAIPFRTLRYPRSEGPASWGFNVYRVIRRKNEETLWSSWEREGGGFHKVGRAGRLEGLADLPRSRLNLELKPYGLFGGSEERGAAGEPARDGQLDFGLDGKWELRPGLVLDATVHPDFAQVEADDEQVNLTRFDLFFPEKREFFLENAGIFEFGTRGFGEPPPFLMFFSRRIGLSEDEEAAVPILGGLRLSGRAGRQTVGLLDVLTDRAFGLPRENFGVLRVKRDVGKSGFLGAMLTDRRSGDAANTAFGADLSLWPRKAWNVQAFVARTRRSAAAGEGDGDAWRLAVDYTGERFGLNLQQLVVDPGADAGMGFLTRTDVRRSDLFGRVTLRPALLGLRKLELFAGGQYVTRVDGAKQDAGLGPFVSVEWESGEHVSAYYFHGYTVLDEAFDLADRVPVPASEYDVGWLGLAAGTSPNRAVAVNLEGSYQRSYGGAIDSTGGNVVLRTGSHLALKAGYRRDHVDLPTGGFDADLALLRLSWAFSTRLSGTAFVQYNGLDRRIVTNLRLVYTHRPGSDLYLVVNEERGSGRSLREVASRGVAVKLTYLARF
jgi:hypothetical protein